MFNNQLAPSRGHERWDAQLFTYSHWIQANPIDFKEEDRDIEENTRNNCRILIFMYIYIYLYIYIFRGLEAGGRKVCWGRVCEANYVNGTQRCHSCMYEVLPIFAKCCLCVYIVVQIFVRWQVGTWLLGMYVHV